MATPVVSLPVPEVVGTENSHNKLFIYKIRYSISDKYMSISDKKYSGIKKKRISHSCIYIHIHT